MGTVILTIISVFLAAFTLFVVIVVILLLSDLLKITHFQMWQRLKKPPLSKFFWKNLIGLGIFIGFFAFMFIGTNSYPELGYQLVKEADKVLIKHGICSDSNNTDCRKYRLLFRGSSGEHALLHFYQIENIK